ncbi:MAG: hypothetical protein Q4E06_02920 [Lautropia sp.]|nr:hypothetical protein [Lautropia sp.]
MSHDMPASLLMFVDEHPTTMVADLWRLMNEAPGMGCHADFDLIAESLLRVILCEAVPEPVQTAARQFCQAYTAHALREQLTGSTLPRPRLLH